jgi:RNA polymerase sigma-70 factor (ECF subfamily)
MIMAEHTPDIDTLLLTRAADEADLCDALVRGYSAYLERVALSILHDPHDAQDVVQESLLRALQHIKDYQPETSLRSWLTTITVNACRDLLRRHAARARLQRLLSWMGKTSDTPRPLEELSEADESRRELWTLVDELDEKHRLPLLLRYAHGLSASEIAQALGLNEGTVHSRLHYAIRKLQAAISPADERLPPSEERDR